MSDHEHRMDHDGGWKGAITYGRHIKDFWNSDVNRAVVNELLLTEGETALDVGAGMGAGVFVAAPMVGASGCVLAIEPTSFMRRILRFRRMLSRSGRRVSVSDGVAERLPFDDGSVDVVWAVNVLHHISDLGAAAAEFRRVMTPGGRLLLVDEDFDDPAHPSHEHMMERHGGKHHHEGGDHHHEQDEDGHHHLMVDIDALAVTLREAGLVEVKSEMRLVAGVPAKTVVATKPTPG